MKNVNPTFLNADLSTPTREELDAIAEAVIEGRKIIASRNKTIEEQGQQIAGLRIERDAIDGECETPRADLIGHQKSLVEARETIERQERELRTMHAAMGERTQQRDRAVELAAGLRVELAEEKSAHKATKQRLNKLVGQQ